jgi:hypothetical protein
VQVVAGELLDAENVLPVEWGGTSSTVQN